ncbi:Tyrosine phosphatase IVA1 [Giardia muris]|uniref:Tyrosine phosphatase IVA1 n=1 Tax=Giardia muris TaxID=5742 RepID=A0A4Z1SPM3_GIAMU|nr:Tyrosine phosphatase IVA1 [Giardia muris]|eukprot:TNJ27774.1 Tyrosine phosphatase IVA1 [Giardia muris]
MESGFVERVPEHTSVISYKNVSFHVIDTPGEASLPSYFQYFDQFEIHTLVLVTPPAYDVHLLENHGVTTLDLSFNVDDGPGQSQIDGWFSVVNQAKGQKKPVSICIQGIYGGTRAPLMVALGLYALGLSIDKALLLISENIKAVVFQPHQLDFLYWYCAPRAFCAAL